MVAEALVNDRDESMAFDVARKIKMPMRLLDVPFLLELGCCFTIVCGKSATNGRKKIKPKTGAMTYCFPKGT